MIRFILFLKKIHFVLLFIILEFLALHYYANSTSYTKAKLVTASNYVVGGIHAQLAGVINYFHLRSENTRLNNELAELQNRLDLISHEMGENHTQVIHDTLPFIRDEYSLPVSARRYKYYPARVINNSVSRQENYITLDKGVQDGLRSNMALISGGGIIGYVLGCSERFSVCMSVLNRNFITSGRLKGTNHTGTVSWDGTSYEHITLSELPKYAVITPGDTIVTTNLSSFFPPDLMIGTVEKFELINATYYDVKIKLHGNLTTLNHVRVVENLDREEELMLEQSFGIYNDERL